MNAPGRDIAQARFYGILDTAYVKREAWVDKCKALIAGGADLIQVRAKNEDYEERRELVLDIMPLFAETDAPYLIINDDVELAAAVPGAGLHVGQDDMPVAQARAAIGNEKMLGLSTHSFEQACGALDLAEHLNYFAVGPVFSTQTKPDYTPVGLRLVGQVSNHVRNLQGNGQLTLPFFAIGGINRTNVDQVREAGAERIVVVSDVLLDNDTAGAVRSLRSAVE